MVFYFKRREKRCGAILRAAFLESARSNLLTRMTVGSAHERLARQYFPKRSFFKNSDAGREAVASG